MKPKIMLVSYWWETAPTGGATVAVKQLAEYLKTDFEVCVLTAAPGRHPHRRFDSGVQVISIPTHNLYHIAAKDDQPGWKKVIFQLLDTWNPFVYGQAKKVIQTEKPDIVHVHKLRGLSPAVWSAAAACGVSRIIHTCHDYELVSPQGTLAGRIGQLVMEKSPLLRPYQTIRAKASRAVNCASAPSHFNLDMHVKTGFFKQARKAVISNSHGFDLGRLKVIKREQLQNSLSHLNILFIGRLDADKGIMPLCEAFNITLEKLPAAELHFVGWGPLEEFIKEMANKNRRMTYHGPLFGTSKEKLLSECTVLVVPSTIVETFGIVIPEAYAFGKPVIASRIGGIPEIVKEGVTGWLVPPGDVHQLQQAIEHVLENPGQVEVMRAACFEEAKLYTPEIVFQQYLDLYRSH